MLLEYRGIALGLSSLRQEKMELSICGKVYSDVASIGGYWLYSVVGWISDVIIKELMMAYSSGFSDVIVGLNNAVSRVKILFMS